MKHVGLALLFARHLRLLRIIYREREIPLFYWLALRSLIKRLFRTPDPLISPYAQLQRSGASLAAEELRELLWNDILGTWALDAKTIDLLWTRLHQDRPCTIIECGAGVSTLVLARYGAFHDLQRTRKYKVFSLEQDLEIKNLVEDRLAQHGLGEYVNVVHTPLTEGGEFNFDIDNLAIHLGQDKADWLLIDGPAGPDGCRISTLPKLSRFCRIGSRWFLDDAFRDAELEILTAWSKLPGVIVSGIHPVGKGLATGVVKDPTRVGFA